MVYASPPINTTSWNDLFVAVNTATDGWFGALTLLAVFMLVLIGLKWGTTPAKSAVSASFITFVLSVMYFIVGITTWYVVVCLLLLTIGTGIASYNENK